MSRLETILPPIGLGGSIDESSHAAEELATGKEPHRVHSLASNQNILGIPQSVALTADEEQRFSWLGILAKYATFTAQTAATLWECSVEEAESTLQGWADQQILVEKQWSQAGLSPLKHIYQLPVSLHQVAYTGLLQNNSLAPRDAHATLIERYQALTHKRLWHTLEDDGYIHAHLTGHLQAADRCDEIHILLQEEAESGANGWYEACDRNGYTAFYCRDVALAWQLAEEQYDQSPIQAIQLQCRYAMMTVAHHRVVASLPASLVAAFVRQHVWTPTQSITYLELIQTPQHQFEALQNLIPVLPATYHPYLLSVIQHQSNPPQQAQLLCLLAPLLEATLFPKLLEIIQAIGTDFYKAIVLREVSALLPTSFLDQTVAIAQTLSLSDQLVAACGIVARWPQTTAIYFKQLIHSLEAGIEESICAEFLEVIVSAVSDTHKAQTLELIHSIKDPSIRIDLLLLLLPQHPDLLSVTFQTACAIRSEWSCALALSKVAPYLSDIDIQLALSILEKFENGSAYRPALKPICAHHPSPHIVAKVLRIIDALPTELERGQALGEIFPYVSPAIQSQIKTQISAYTNVNARILSFCHLAIADKSIFSTALHWISQCQDSVTQFKAYWILSQQWPKLTPAAVSAACQIIDPDAQVLAFHQLAPHLTDEQMQQVLTIAKQAKSKDKRGRILTELIPYCSHNLLLSIQTVWNQHREDRVYASVLSSLKSQLTSSELKLSPWDARKRAIDSLTALLPDDLLHQTLSVTFDFVDKVSCAKSLSRLLPQIHPSQIDYPQWCQILHALTALDQDSFLLNFPKLMPMMEYLAGSEIHHGTLQNIQTIHRQW